VTITAVYDANVLYPSLLRDLLIRLGVAGAVRARWTGHILDEVFENLVANRPDLDPRLLARTRALMNDAIRDAVVGGFEGLIDDLTLPDENDRHVLAAAIHAEADVIVTANLKDFPLELVAEHGIVAQHPDAFLVERLDENGPIVMAALQQISRSTRNPPLSVDEIITRLDILGLPALTDRLRSRLR
jgi:predicted nucleic acid-binding protein